MASEILAWEAAWVAQFAVMAVQTVGFELTHKVRKMLEPIQLSVGQVVEN